MLQAPDRFEYHHDRIGVTLETFRREFRGGWIFSYIEALRCAGIRTVLFYASAQVTRPVRFEHEPTGTPVRVFPSPRLQQKVQGARDRYRPDSGVLKSIESYLAIPLRALAAQLRREGCDLILCQEYEYARFAVCVALGRWLQLPVFATFQGATRGTSRLEAPARRLTLGACAGLIVPARQEVERVLRRYRLPAGKVAYVPNPVDVHQWKPTERARARAELGISERTRVVVWHGRVEIHKKGLDILLDAWRRLADRRPEGSDMLVLVGDGKGARELRQRLEAQRFSNVRWDDHFVNDRSELVRYLSAADVYVMPSRSEGFPVAAVEAMACGLPLVASQGAGLEDILEAGEASGGVLVPREDPAALAEALHRLLDNPDWAQELGSRARCRVERSFSIEAVGEQLGSFLSDRGSWRGR